METYIGQDIPRPMSHAQEPSLRTMESLLGELMSLLDDAYGGLVEIDRLIVGQPPEIDSEDPLLNPHGLKPGVEFSIDKARRLVEAINLIRSYLV